MKKPTLLALVAMIPAIGLVLSNDTSAYATNGATWADRKSVV